MPRNKEETEGLSLLGNKKTVYKDTYAPEVLETFVNKHQGNDYMVTFDCPEFTSLCPITGQPDFAKITINYIPNVKMVESKSLKLYLFRTSCPFSLIYRMSEKCHFLVLYCQGFGLIFSMFAAGRVRFVNH